MNNEDSDRLDECAGWSETLLGAHDRRHKFIRLLLKLRAHFTRRTGYSCNYSDVYTLSAFAITKMFNPSPAEPGYALHLQTVQIQISWLLQKPTDLDLYFLSLSMWVGINNLDQVSDWLSIRNGHAVLIYSAWQGLRWLDILSGETTL